MKFDSSSCMLKPVYFAFVKTMLECFLQTTHFVKSRELSPRPTSKIIATIALRRAILMKANPVVSLHAHRLFSGRACSCKKDPCCYSYVVLYQPIIKRSGVACKLLIIIEKSREYNKKCKFHVCRLLFTGNVTQYSFEAED